LIQSRAQLIVDILKKLNEYSPDIEASVVLSNDGLPIASLLPAGTEEDRVSAMAAAMLSLGERIATEFKRGSLAEVYIKGEYGYIILMAVGQKSVLTVLAHEQVKLGLILLEMRRTAENLSSIL
jgi:uncharacterized protein